MPLQGYYLKSWECDSWRLPQGTNTVVYFSGFANFWSGFNEANECRDRLGLHHDAYFSFGGGNSNGRITASSLDVFAGAIWDGRLDGYHGIVLDVEEGDSWIESSYDKVINAAKDKNLKVVVTTSHSAPYGVGDSENLMYHLIKNPQIDFLSPQLYSSGEEGSNEYDLTGCDGQNRQVWWNTYSQSSASFAPSIVAPSYYESATDYFRGQGVKTNGYIAWK